MDEFIAAVKPLIDDQQEQIDQIKQTIGGDYSNGSSRQGLASHLRDTERIAVEALTEVRSLGVKTDQLNRKFDSLEKKFDRLMDQHQLNLKVQRVGSSVGIAMVLGIVLAPVGIALHSIGCVTVGALLTIGIPAWFTATGGLIALLYKIK